MNTEWEIVDESERDQRTEGSTPLPDNNAAVAETAIRCHKIVKQRALMSSAASLVPLPGFDVLVDVSLLIKLFDDINQHFGLTPEQIQRLSPQRRAMAYQAIVGVGSTVIGKVITQELVMAVLRRFGVRLTLKQAARWVPIAGQAGAASGRRWG